MRERSDNCGHGCFTKEPAKRQYTWALKSWIPTATSSACAIRCPPNVGAARGGGWVKVAVTVPRAHCGVAVWLRHLQVPTENRRDCAPSRGGQGRHGRCGSRHLPRRAGIPVRETQGCPAQTRCGHRRAGRDARAAPCRLAFHAISCQPDARAVAVPRASRFRRNWLPCPTESPRSCGKSRPDGAGFRM